jgi:tetratricopeptide (TPR) repeat protein
VRPIYILAPLLILAASTSAQPPAAPPAQATPHVAHEANFDTERAQANQLYLAGKALEALPLYEDLCRQDSTIAVFAERHGSGLIAKAGTVSDPAQHNALMTDAVKELRRAESLGDNSPYVETLLSTMAKTPIGMAVGGPMGTLPLTVGYTHSGSAKAQPLFQQAEAAFGQKDLPTALKLYLAAAAADPAWYSPALYAGDVYYRLQDYPNAYIWYAKAIAIDPDRETAYRYWADALVKAGDMAGARVKNEQAYIAEPYTMSTVAGLQQWTTLAHLQLTQPRVGRPQFTMKDGQFTEAPLLADNGTGLSSWLAYRQSRIAHDPKVVFNQWIMSGSVSADPSFTFTPNGYVHTVAEEKDALNAMLLDLHARLASGALTQDKLDPSLKFILQVQKDNMLEPFILFSFNDAGLRHGYPDYRAAHRDQLVQYVDRYFIGGPVPPNTPNRLVQPQP